jgi:hypothetical protein
LISPDPTGSSSRENGGERGRRRRLAIFYRDLRADVRGEGVHDPEPEPRFTLAWTAWLSRDVTRRSRIAEIAESEALTIYAEDPAPLASMGFPVFHEWAIRQHRRRRARSLA